MPWTISLQDLTFSYPSSQVIIDHASTNFHSGDVTTLLGKNGAGKTTLLDLITNNLEPQGGSVGYGVDGLAVQYPTDRIGYMSSSFFTYDRLTVSEMTGMVASLRGLTRRAMQAALRRYESLLGLEQYRDSPVGTLSTGSKARFHLLVTLLHEPEIIILDEPTNGLDPSQFAVFQHLLATLREEGRLIIVSTHSIRLAAQTSTRVLMLRSGRLEQIAHSDLHSLEREFE